MGTQALLALTLESRLTTLATMAKEILIPRLITQTKPLTIMKLPLAKERSQETNLHAQKLSNG